MTATPTNEPEHVQNPDTSRVRARARAKRLSCRERSQLLAELCEHLEMGGTIREFCKQPGRPKRSTIYEWLESDPDALKQFEKAKLLGNEERFDRVLEIASTPEIGEVIEEERIVIEGEDGSETPATKQKVTKADMLGHRKHLAHVLMQLLARSDPARYGSKTTLKHEGKVGVSLEELIGGSMDPETPRPSALEDSVGDSMSDPPPRRPWSGVGGAQEQP